MSGRGLVGQFEGEIGVPRQWIVVNSRQGCGQRRSR